ncbi:MAG: hypothetical protein IJ764_02300 [Bacteroidales bacterium]|nr:hypothetical protein [Bacteroidales bacterium]
MEKNSSIIAIRKLDVVAANRHFANLMGNVEYILNQEAQQYVEKFRKMKPNDLEIKSYEIIKKACINTPFNPESVKLVSGLHFPDIIAEGFYGVEVKSTNKNHWTSTGSSIVENTRIEGVENIYMLFGKLGGCPAEFRCRPYQEVLYDIAVTHSPRYLIDMELNDGETIFDKMGTSYDELRQSSDSIEYVKKYYKRMAMERGGQMPWWIGTEDDDTDPIAMNIRRWSSLRAVELDELRTQILILFPEVVNGNYDNAAMWLASAKGIVNHCIRDNFSAGGKIKCIAGKVHKEGLPRIWGTLAKNYDRVRKLLCKDSPIIPYIREYNPALLAGEDMYVCWMTQIEQRLLPIRIGNDIFHIKEVLEQRLIQ